MTYHEMATTSAPARAALRAVKATVLGAEFYLDPYSDDQQKMDEAEFAAWNIFDAPSAPFLWSEARILKMLEYGFHIMEPVYELREWGPKRAKANRKKYTTLRKLGPRFAPTIKDIHYDANGGPEGITQFVIDDKTGKTKEKDIDIDKLMIFTFDEDDGDLMGKSILRSAHQHWFYQNHMWKIDAIQKERHGIGIPDIELAPGYNSKDKEAAHTLGRNLRSNEWAHIVRPPGMTVGFAKVEGQLVDILKSVNEHTLMIFLGVLANFMLAGSTEAGSRATSSSQQDIFMKSNRWIANLVCEMFNMFLIPKLIGYNFDTDEFPKLKVRNIGETRDLQQLFAAVANATHEDVIVPDDGLEAWARRVFDMPLKQPETARVQSTEIITRDKTKEAEDAAAGNGKGAKGSSPSVIRSGNMGKGNNVT
jgi:hypothetical protein